MGSDQILLSYRAKVMSAGGVLVGMSSDKVSDFPKTPIIYLSPICVVRSISIRLYGAEAARLLNAVDEHPALSKNHLGRLAAWLGLKVIAEQPEWVDQGLREMRAARESHRAVVKAVTGNGSGAAGGEATQ